MDLSEFKISVEVRDGLTHQSSYLKRNLLSQSSTIGLLTRGMIKLLLGNICPSILNLIQNKSFQSIGLAKNGEQYFNNPESNIRETFSILSNIDDNLLTEGDMGSISLNNRESQKTITGKIDPSLFQGFKNKVSKMNEISSKLQDPSNISDYKNDLAIELNIDTDSIERSYSLKVLDGISYNIFEKLDFFEVHKASLENEIDDLNDKLEEINSKKEKIFERIADIKDVEVYLKNTIITLTTRKHFIKTYGIGNESSNETASEQDTKENNLLKYFQGSDREGIEKIKLGSDIDTRSSTPGSVSVEMMPGLDNSMSSLTSKHGSDLEKFYAASQKRRKYISESFQNHYQKGATIAKLQKAHDDKITCLDFDFPFGTLATAGHLDPVIKLWDLSKRQQFGALKGHMASISCLQMDSKYNILISGSKDATLRLWNIDIGIEQYRNGDAGSTPLVTNDPCLYTFSAHSDEISALSFDDNNLVSGSRDKTIKQWDLNSGKCIQTINLNTITKSNSTQIDMPFGIIAHPPIVGAIQCYDAALATGTRDGAVRLWDLRIGKVVRAFEGHHSAISALQFDSSLLISGSLDKTVKIWDLGSGCVIDNFTYTAPVSSLSFDDKNVTVATEGGHVSVFSREKNTHWDCDNTSETTSTSSYVKYNEGYMVEGRSNGDINVWSV